MPPPSKAPRLAGVDARELAREITTLTKDVSFGDVVALVKYAQDGVGDYAGRFVAGVLYGTPLNGHWPFDPEDVVEGSEPAREIDVVLLAAQARYAIETDAPVTVRGLAALASVGASQVTRAMRAGALGHAAKGKDGRAGPPITAKAAALWLSRRKATADVQ